MRTITVCLLLAAGAAAHASPQATALGPLATPAQGQPQLGEVEVPDVPGATGPQGIVNGTAATRDLFPATGVTVMEASITPRDPFTGQLAEAPVLVRTMACSSTLIAPDVVLLAAHCLDEFALSQGGLIEGLDMRWSQVADVGTSDAFGRIEWPADAIRAAGWVLPDDWSIYNIQGTGTFGGDDDLLEPKWDIALLFLEEAVTGVEPALLVTPEESELIEEGGPVQIVGWGIQEPLGLLEQLSGVTGTSGQKMWGDSTLGTVGQFEFQVGPAADDVRKCKGDSGGPTFMDVGGPGKNTTRLIGVTSRSSNLTLCQVEGGFDTRVDHYLDWIDEEMRRACEDGVRVGCQDDDNGILLPAAGCSTTGLPAGGIGLLALGLLGWRRRQ